MPCLTTNRRPCLFTVTAIACWMPASLALGQQQQPPRPLPPVTSQTVAGAAQPVAQRLPQPAAPQGAQPQLAPQAPPGFELNALQQAFLNQVLDKWQAESGKIQTFSCRFERLDFNAAFRPAENMPLSIDQGELSYSKPDKGSFRISEIKKWQQKQAPSGQPAGQVQGEYVVQSEAIGEHWVCDGKSVFEYRHNQKLLVERPIPPQLQGMAIMDGPLPFLFGADANKLKARYWLRVIHDNQTEIWLEAQPRHQADAANFSLVRVILDRQKVLPKAMEVNLPDRSRHVYKFDLANASINHPLARIGALFDRPRTPPFWKHVIDEPPVEQASQPAQAPR
jgi:TIGR03009 family protein